MGDWSRGYWSGNLGIGYLVADLVRRNGQGQDSLRCLEIEWGSPHVTDTEITLLDGATGTELRARGVHVRDYKSSLWSALACVEAPDAVIKLQRDYLDAGSDIITVNNYAVTPVLLAREGLGNELEALTVKAAQCAVAARDSAQRPALVAGSLPPLNTTYDVSLVGDFDDNIAHYRRMVAALNPYVDLYLCETLSTAEEARAAAVAAQAAGPLSARGSCCGAATTFPRRCKPLMASRLMRCSSIAQAAMRSRPQSGACEG